MREIFELERVLVALPPSLQTRADAGGAVGKEGGSVIGTEFAKWGCSRKIGEAQLELAKWVKEIPSEEATAVEGVKRRGGPYKRSHFRGVERSGGRFGVRASDTDLHHGERASAEVSGRLPLGGGGSGDIRPRCDPTEGEEGKLE